MWVIWSAKFLSWTSDSFMLLGISPSVNCSPHSSNWELNSKASLSKSRSCRHKSKRNFRVAHNSPSSSRCPDNRSKVVWIVELELLSLFNSSKRVFPSAMVEAHASKVESLWAPNCSKSRSAPSKESATSSLSNSIRNSVNQLVNSSVWL